MEQLNLNLEHDAFGRLIVIDKEGHRHVGVVPIRAFPYSAPTTWISLCDPDGREMECIPDLAKLSPHARSVLEANLAQREFVPVIRRIVGISTGPVPTKWEVETDRGPTEFLLTSEDDIRALSRHRVLVMDSHGVRFMIPDLRELDMPSRRLLRRYL